MKNCVKNSAGTGVNNLDGGTDSNNYGLDNTEKLEMKSNDEETYRTKGNLKAASGWTEKLIKELLGEPDYIHEFYHYIFSGGHCRTEVHSRSQRYLATRVEAAESTEAFKNGRKILAWERMQLNAVGGAN